MTELRAERCDVCRPDTPPISDAEIADLQPLIPDWEIATVGEQPRLRRTYRFTSYPEALDFVQRVGTIAEEEGHHPTMTVEWGKVRVSWWTHAIKGLTRNDFIMAAKTDAVFTR